MKKEKPRNYEFRSIPGVAKDLKVSRDGEVQLKGKPYFGRELSLRGIRTHKGEYLSIQMAIHKAFPDIPMRVVPTR